MDMFISQICSLDPWNGKISSANMNYIAQSHTCTYCGESKQNCCIIENPYTVQIFHKDIIPNNLI